MCKKLRTGVVQAVQTIPAYPTSTYSTLTQPMPLPIVRPQPSALPLATLDLTDQLAWIAERRAQLQKKQQRERAYLDRRAARGAHTPTDDAYEADALLEDELLEALDLLEDCLQDGSLTPGLVSAKSTYAGDTSFLFPDPGLHAKP